MGFGQRVDAVRLEPRLGGIGAFMDLVDVAQKTLKEKGHRCRLRLLGNCRESGLQVLIVLTTVIGWNLHANQEYFGLGTLAQLGHLQKIRSSHVEREAPQGIVGPQFNHHELGVMGG